MGENLFVSFNHGEQLVGSILKFGRPQAGTSTQPGIFRDTREVLQHLQPDHPVYLFRPRRLEQRAAFFRTHFPGRVSYAVKANSRHRVLSTLVAQGIRDFDAASLSEIIQLAALDQVLHIHFNNPVKSEHAIRAACHDHGVRSFALDDMTELKKILRICRCPEQLILPVRFKLPSHRAAYDFGAKFGAKPGQAACLLAAIARTGARPALTFHPGSQCADPKEYRRYIYAAADIARQAGVPLACLNVGGGFPERYTNSSLSPLADYIRTIQHAAAEAFPKGQPPLICEPGRAMVASSISLLSQVIHVRRGERIVFINDGIYGGLQEQSLTNFELPLKVWRNGRLLLLASAPFTVFGPTCDPLDRLPSRLNLPLGLRAGDYLEFDLVGAYGSATATRFNGFDSSVYLNVSGA